MKYFFIFHKICDSDKAYESISYNDFKCFCSAARAFNMRSSESEIILTFDDGFASDLKAYETAGLYDLKTLHFIVPSFIDTEPYLSLDDVILLSKSGATIGSHSYRHTDLNSLNVSDLRQDLDLSKAWFIKTLGFNATIMSLPFGKAKKTVLKTINEYYKYIYTSGIYHKDLKTVRRYGINKNNVKKDIDFLVTDYTSFARKFRYLFKELIIQILGTKLYLKIRLITSKTQNFPK